MTEKSRRLFLLRAFHYPNKTVWLIDPTGFNNNPSGYPFHVYKSLLVATRYKKVPQPTVDRISASKRLTTIPGKNENLPELSYTEVPATVDTLDKLLEFLDIEAEENNANQ